MAVETIAILPTYLLTVAVANPGRSRQSMLFHPTPPLCSTLMFAHCTVTLRNYAHAWKPSSRMFFA